MDDQTAAAVIAILSGETPTKYDDSTIEITNNNNDIDNDNDNDDNTKTDKKISRDVRWMKKLESLKAFRKVHGHCNVPCGGDAACRQLGHWVGYQRKACEAGRLREKRKELLNEIGFVWGVSEARRRHRKKLDDHWFQRFDSLKVFREEHGHCRVPNSDGQLGKWVHNQRMALKEGRMREDRKALLDEIGFVWKRYRDTKKREVVVAAETEKTTSTVTPIRHSSCDGQLLTIHTILQQYSR